jgi:hypothetical protein
MLYIIERMCIDCASAQPFEVRHLSITAFGIWVGEGLGTNSFL